MVRAGWRGGDYQRGGHAGRGGTCFSDAVDLVPGGRGGVLKYLLRAMFACELFTACT